MTNVSWLIEVCRITDGLCGCLLLKYEIYNWMALKSAVWLFISCVAVEEMIVFIFIWIICHHYLSCVSFFPRCIFNRYTVEFVGLYIATFILDKSRWGVGGGGCVWCGICDIKRDAAINECD